MWYSNLENKHLWQIFNDISRIPRESGNEEGIRNYLLSWSRKHGLEARTDSIGNVIIKAPATEGCGKIPPIALQGHMDMVCVKKDNSTHDFKKDPISITTDGTLIRARGTSLGADNGIAMAMALDILSDKTAKHGPLEAIFTVSEETGMDGASALMAEDLEARRLINLDSEEEGIIYVGCAGGADIEATMKVKYEEATGTALRVKVSGLRGGHSGSEIGEERANAIQILARYLARIPYFQIASINGGTRHNVIPSTAEAIITVADKEAALSIAENLQKELKNEYSVSDPDIKLSISDAPMPETAIKRKKSMKIADSLFVLPHGVASMNLRFSDVVETSDNLAIISLDKEKLHVSISVRSSMESRKMALCSKLQTILESFGYKSWIASTYPAWEPDIDSEFTKKFVKSYHKHMGKKPRVTVIHAGLECGIINSRIPGMESVSIGPELRDVHSVNENLNVKSAERTAACLKQLLQDLS